jgi:hypothetical protein
MTDQVPPPKRSLADLLGRKLAESSRELMLFAGLGLLAYGCSLVFWPAAFVVPGAILVAVAVFGVR